MNFVFMIPYNSLKKLAPTSVRRLFKPFYQNFYLRNFTSPSVVLLKSPLENVNLWVDPENGAVDEYIFIHQQWEVDIAQILSEHLDSQSVFIDVGANIGAFTVPAAKKLTENGRVIAFEPIPRLATQIEQSLTENSLYNVEVVNKACGVATGEQEIMINSNNIGGSSLVGSKKEASEQKIIVSVTTLDTELSSITKIDVIKIDVEGYELEVLQGAEKTLKKHMPVLVIEFSPQMYNLRSKTMSEDILQLLMSFGYKIKEIERGTEVDDIANYLTELGNRQVNILCTVV